MPDLITRAELARRAGVTQAAITKACRGELAPAMKDRHVDADHPAVAAYVARSAARMAAAKAARSAPPRRPSNAEVDALADLAVRVIQRVAARLRSEGST